MHVRTVNSNLHSSMYTKFSLVQFSSFIYFRICKYNDIDLNKNKKNTHNDRFYNLISSINSI